ncbi:MAG: hypothetical protein KKD92_09150 [Proteobacteria bacterium]|nr:hypothetical protein [Pseudomonadota bacterium]
MKNLLVLMGILVLLTLTSCATITTSSKARTPLPEPGTLYAVNIIPPGPEVPPKIANFSGTWEGEWPLEVRLATVIVIEDIDFQSKKVTAIYSWGNAARINADWAQARGFIKEDSIVLKVGGKVTVTLSPIAGRSDIIDATYEGWGFSKTQLKKKQ